MKRTTIYLSAVLVLQFSLAACTQGEACLPPNGTEGSPIVFIATGLPAPTTASAVGTRAPVGGNWEGVQRMAVMIDGTVKTYRVHPATDDTSATLTSDDPHYWTTRNELIVSAWWPCIEGESTIPVVVVKSDQSTPEAFASSDCIVAIDQPVTSGSPRLDFTHRTVLVRIVLTECPAGLSSVQLTNLSTGNGNPTAITPLKNGSDHTYSALVAPQSIAQGTAFITCKFDNGRMFVYKIRDTTEWKAGEAYTYTVSLAAADPGYPTAVAAHPPQPDRQEAEGAGPAW